MGSWDNSVQLHSVDQAQSLRAKYSHCGAVLDCCIRCRQLVDTKMVNESDGHMAGLAAKAHDEFHDLLPVSLHSPCFLHNMEWTQLLLMFIL